MLGGERPTVSVDESTIEAEQSPGLQELLSKVASLAAQPLQLINIHQPLYGGTEILFQNGKQFYTLHWITNLTPTHCFSLQLLPRENDGTTVAPSAPETIRFNFFKTLGILNVASIGGFNGTERIAMSSNSTTDQLTDALILQVQEAFMKFFATIQIIAKAHGIDLPELSL